MLLSTSSISTGVLSVGRSFYGVITTDFAGCVFVFFFIDPGIVLSLVLVFVGEIALSTFSFFLYHFAENRVVPVRGVRSGCRL